jgi:hypothetical protein
MVIRVFISHSVAPRELALVNSVADIVAQRGAIPVIPDRTWNPISEDVPERIAVQIRDSDYVVGIASQWGHHAEWLNKEVAYGRLLQPAKPTLVVADREITIAPAYECVRMDRTNPLATLGEIERRIQGLVSDQQTQNLLRGLLVGGLVLLFLRAK